MSVNLRTGVGTALAMKTMSPPTSRLPLGKSSPSAAIMRGLPELLPEEYDMSALARMGADSSTSVVGVGGGAGTGSGSGSGTTGATGATGAESGATGWGSA